MGPTLLSLQFPRFLSLAPVTEVWRSYPYTNLLSPFVKVQQDEDINYGKRNKLAMKGKSNGSVDGIEYRGSEELVVRVVSMIK